MIAVIRATASSAAYYDGHADSKAKNRAERADRVIACRLCPGEPGRGGSDQESAADQRSARPITIAHNAEKAGQKADTEPERQERQADPCRRIAVECDQRIGNHEERACE